MAFYLQYTPEYVSPKKQIEAGLAHSYVLCRDDKVLAARNYTRINDNGMAYRGDNGVVCVTESTAKKMDWFIYEREFDLSKMYILAEIVAGMELAKQQGCCK